MNASLWSQNRAEEFVIRTYGFPSWDDYDQVSDSISTKWEIHYRPVAGCVVSDEFVDSIEQLNNLTYQKLDEFYGKDWKTRLEQEIDSSYNLLLIKKENTYKIIAACSNIGYYFQARRNLSGKQTQLDIVAFQAKNKRKNDIKITGSQNKDPNVAYRGYANKFEIEFNFPEDTLFLSLRCSGSFYLDDSCLVTNKIHFTYYTSSQADTLFIKKSNGEIIQHIFNVQNISPPRLTLNNQPLGSTFSRKQLKNRNEISAKSGEDVLINQNYKIESWEIVANGKSYKGSGNIIPVEVSKELKKLEPGTIIGLFTTVSSGDSVKRKKAATFKLI